MGGYNSSFSSPQFEQAITAALLQEKSSYNITQDKKQNYASLTEAIAAVSDEKYKVNGLVLTFYTGTEWVSKRYNGADASGFATEDNWVEAGGASEVSDGDSYNASYFLELAQLGESGTVSQENYNNLKEAIISNKYIYASLTSVEQNGTMFLPISGLYINDGILQLFIHQGLNIGNFVINPDLSYTFSTISGGASEHTLDLSPLFDEEGSPVATVTDEFLAEVKKAYEEKYSNALYNGAISPMYISFDAESQYYLILFDIDTGESGSYTKYKFTSRIHVSDKSSEFSMSILNIKQDGRGNQCLTDNGQYAEFASPVKVENGGSGTVTKQLSPNTLYEFGECTSLTITLAAEISGIRNEYMFEFVSGTTPTMLSIPETVGWMGGEAPTIEANKTYQCSIVNNIAVIGGK